MIALRVSFGFSFESMKSTCTLRPPIPPLALTYLPQPWTPSTMPLSTPGAIGLSTSATTATLMVLAVTPTSLVVLASWCSTAPGGHPDERDPEHHASTATTPATDDLRMNFPPLSTVRGGIMTHSGSYGTRASVIVGIAFRPASFCRPCRTERRGILFAVAGILLLAFNVIDAADRGASGGNIVAIACGAFLLFYGFAVVARSGPPPSP